MGLFKNLFLLGVTFFAAVSAGAVTVRCPERAAEPRFLFEMEARSADVLNFGGEFSSFVLYELNAKGRWIEIDRQTVRSVENVSNTAMPWISRKNFESSSSWLQRYQVRDGQGTRLMTDRIQLQREWNGLEQRLRFDCLAQDPMADCATPLGANAP